MVAAMTARRPRRLAYLLLLFSCALLVAAAALYLAPGAGLPSALHLTRAEWQEQEAPAYREPPAELDSNVLPHAWQTVALSFQPSIALLRQAGGAAAARGQTGVRVSWIRIPVDGAAAGVLAGAARLAVYGARVKTDGTVAVYVDGRLVHRAQAQGPLWNSTRTPLWFSVDTRDGGGHVREILLRLEHSPRSQVALSSLRLGPPESLRTRYRLRLWLQQELPAMLGTAFMAVGLFALFVWWRRPHEIAYLLFFNLAATAFLRGLHFYTDLPIANDWFAWLTVNSLFWLVLSVHFFLRLLHGRRLVWLTRALVSVTAAIGVLTTPLLSVLPNMPTVTPLIYPVAALMCLIATAVAAVNSWRHSSEGRLVVCGLFGCIALGIGDWLLQNNFVSAEGCYLGAYTPALCFIVFGMLMYRRYLDAMAEVERVNASLALRLAAREAELEASHARLRQAALDRTIAEERQRLMQDMHDGLGSSLIGAIRAVELGKTSAERVSLILKDCLDDLKLTIDSMEPVEADLLLLLATLRFRLEPRLEDAGVRLLWEVQEVPTLDWLNPSRALHILRIVQECISNILRHTRATEIRVGTMEADGGVLVCIADNGQGFDPALTLRDGGGRGLQNQLRRAAALEGQVSWKSDAGGTRFTLWLPLALRAAAPG
jgi:signal transduction histidine kinase